MKSTSKKIVFFGTDEFSAASLRELLANNFSIAAVVTKPDSHKGRGRKLTKPAVKEIAEAHAIPVWQPLRVDAIAEHITKLTEKTKSKPVGVLVSYGKIIPRSIIDLFDPGIINVHPSLLPKYRGPSPIETAIANRDSETGVTIMQLSHAMDAGPVYSHITTPLIGVETGPDLELQLAEEGAKELVRQLPAIINGSLKPTPQNEAQATYCQLLTKEDSLLDPEHTASVDAEARVRAFLTFPKTKLVIEGHQVVITKAHVSHSHNSPLDIACSDGKFLTIDELIGPSGKVMNAQAFLNGYVK